MRKEDYIPRFILNDNSSMVSAVTLELEVDPPEHTLTPITHLPDVRNRYDHEIPINPLLKPERQETDGQQPRTAYKSHDQAESNLPPIKPERRSSIIE
jgi:hypothetical protein